MPKKRKQQQGMVDVSPKKMTRRRAVACAEVVLGEKAFEALTGEGSPKGDVLESAKLAGVLAAKSTPTLIPYCHPLALNKVAIRFQMNKKEASVVVSAEVVCNGRTGVEMEAMTAASVSALTIYDMMKWADKGIAIGKVELIEKSGGRSGHYKRA